MTALPQPDASGTVLCYATVETHFTATDGEGEFRYSAPFRYQIDVDELGTIRLDAALADGDRAEITFRLLSEDGSELSFAGICLGRREDHLGPLTLDTHGELYDHDSLPFQVASSSALDGPIHTLVLTEIGKQEEAHSIFFYKIWVRYAKDLYGDDPKIYNKGDGGGGGR